MRPVSGIMAHPPLKATGAPCLRGGQMVLERLNVYPVAIRQQEHGLASGNSTLALRLTQAFSCCAAERDMHERYRAYWPVCPIADNQSQLDFASRPRLALADKEPPARRRGHDRPGQ